jgi:NADH:ubiquinone oxidoreductase subunit 6 (chain J)
MTTLDILFGAVGLITAASAVLAVTTQHLVHAALWLVVTLGTLAGCYLILGAELVALVQLLVYVGAVVVLVLFALMLSSSDLGRSPEHSSSAVQRAAAAVIGAGTTALFASVLLPALGGELRATRAGDTKGLPPRRPRAGAAEPQGLRPGGHSPSSPRAHEGFNRNPDG